MANSIQPSTTGDQQNGGTNYMMMQLHFLVGTDMLVKLFFKSKMIGENQAREEKTAVGIHDSK